MEGILKIYRFYGLDQVFYSGEPSKVGKPSVIATCRLNFNNGEIDNWVGDVNINEEDIGKIKEVIGGELDKGGPERFVERYKDEPTSPIVDDYSWSVSVI